MTLICFLLFVSSSSSQCWFHLTMTAVFPHHNHADLIILHVSLKQRMLHVKPLSLWKGIILQPFADQTSKFLFCKKKLKSPFSSHLTSPFVSIFHPWTYPSCWGMSRPPPALRSITRSWGPELWLRAVKMAASVSDGRCDGAWYYCRRRLDSSRVTSSVSSPECDWAPEVKLTTAKHVMIMKLDRLWKGDRFDLTFQSVYHTDWYSPSWKTEIYQVLYKIKLYIMKTVICNTFMMLFFSCIS